MSDAPGTTPEAIASSGVEGLDQILAGGFRRNHIYLVEGESGAGKTTLALQFALAGARAGERVVYLTLAETPGELTLAAHSHGWSLDQMILTDMTRGVEGELGQQEYSVFHPSEVELHAFIEQIQRLVEREQPDRLVIDPLSTLRSLAADRFRYRRQLAALRNHLSEYKCTVLLIDDTEVAETDFQPRSLAHGILILHRHVEEYGAERRRLRAVKHRGVPIVDGLHDFRITTGGLVVFPRVSSVRQPRQAQRGEPLKMGVAGLDSLTGGGLHRGSSMLITGSAGTGKSTIAAAYASAALIRGERVAYFLFDENPALFLARNEQLGFDMQAHLLSGHLFVQKIDPAEMSPGEFAWQLQKRVEDGLAQIIVIDSISGYLHSMPGTRYLDLHLHQLLAYLGHKGVITLMVLTQHGIIGEATAPADLSYLSDATILIRFFETAGHVRRAISVVKNRGAMHEQTIRELRITQEGIQLSEPLHEFQGVLTGVPQYAGAGTELVKRP
jgi:circadian clock protein KaiC